MREGAASVAAASAVTARVGGLPLAKLGSPAEDLVGTVFPAAARHAGRGVIDFKPAGREKGGRKKAPPPGTSPARTPRSWGLTPCSQQQALPFQARSGVTKSLLGWGTYKALDPEEACLALS